MAKLKWTNSEKEVKQAEDTNEVSWWLLFGALIVMEVIVVGKILMSW